MKTLKNIFLVLGTFVLAMIVGFIADLLLNTHNPMKEDWNESVGTVHKDFAYGDAPAQKFDLYLPANKNNEPCGLVIYLHPGGFTTGDKADDEQILKWFTSKGYVASGINYTLRNEENPTASVKSQTDEIKKAVPYVVEKAKELGYNIDKMAIGGGSAGHCLAAIYAFRDGHQAPLPIAFTFGMVGPMSFQMENSKNKDIDESELLFLSVLVGELLTPEMVASGKLQEKIKPIEAYHWVNENSPPALFGFGKLDRVMPFSIQPMIKALAENNVPNDVIIYEKSGHGLHRDKDKQQLYFEKLNEYLEKYLPVK